MAVPNNETKLHIALFPWLAFGHILPFLQLSKSLAQRGHRISFISTPRNIQTLPTTISPNINIVSLPIHSHINIESTADITSPDQAQHLWETFDALQYPITSFLQESRPDWLIYDFASYWLPSIAAKLDIPCVYFNIFNACMVAFNGSVSEMIGEDKRSRVVPEDYMVPPTWIPFPSCLALRRYEAPTPDSLEKLKSNPKLPVYRLGCAIQGCEFMAVRSCTEFEGEWLSLLQEELCMKPVVPVGLLPPPQNGEGEDGPIKEWLDKQREGSVVYIAFGSESVLSQDQVSELAHGLELSGLPFFWVLRKQFSVLPTGFEDRVKDRGYVTMDWVPQLSILSHRSMGGFLTHSGWSSVVEGLNFGLALILFPLSPPQALNARVLECKKIGLEVPRDERDGLLSRHSIAESLRVVMAQKEGEVFRIKAKEMKEIFGDKLRHERYMDEFERYLREYKKLGTL